MQRINSNKLLVGLAALFFVAAVGLSVPALAREGQDDSSANPTAENENEVEIENHARDLMEKFRMEAREHNQTERAKMQARSHEDRQKSCEARKEALTRRMNRAVTQAEKHKAVFDKIYTRVQQFHDDKNLNTPNYDEQVAKVDAAQTNAAAQISALGSLNISVDCTQGNVADGVSTFKNALGETRDSLKDYRKALVEFIKAVHQSVESSSNSESQ